MWSHDLALQAWFPFDAKNSEKLLLTVPSAFSARH